MKLSYKIIFGIVVLSACVLYTRTQRHEAYSRGDDLYVDGERYIEISGNDYLYQESKKRICKTDDRCIVYEVEGDKEYNYVVRRCLWDAALFVKESYVPDETVVRAICIGRKKDNYIYDEKIIECVLALEDNDEFFDDSDVFLKARIHGRDVYVKYGDEIVGKYIGEIFSFKDQYMYYNDNEQVVTVLTDEQLELLREYL